ncbi:MAG: S26 family signal peptidase [Pirellulaceae bacterium]
MSSAKVALRLWPLWGIVLAGILAGLVGTWWSLRPIEVFRLSSGSMVPTLLGPHYLLTCQRCRISLPLDAAQPLDEWVTCGHCGFQQNDPTSATQRPGDVLRIDPASRSSSWEPSRGDLVLIEQDGLWSVKRVVGLPGEAVELAAGDLWVEGRRVQAGKPSGEPRILVFDQNHDPPDQSRFRAEQAETGWRVIPGELAYRRADDGAEPSADRLVYHHLACLPPPQPAEQPSVPMDDYLFNHQVSRQLFPVSDLWIEFRARRLDEGELTVTLHGEEEDFSRTISADSRNQIIRLGHRDGQFFFEPGSGGENVDFSPPPSNRSAVPTGTSAVPGKKTDFSQPASKRFQPTARPFSFAVEGAAQVLLTDVRIYRDIHYLGPHGREGTYRFPQPVAPRRYLLLGDNVAISEDSRYQEGQGLPRSVIRGRVMLAPNG